MTAPLDFSDLTGKKKTVAPQPPQQQPQQNQQIGIKKSDGTVEPAMGYPVNQMGQGDELLQLFPIPVMICPYPVDYSKELEWIKMQKQEKKIKVVMVELPYIIIANQKIHLF